MAQTLKDRQGRCRRWEGQFKQRFVTRQNLHLSTIIKQNSSAGLGGFTGANMSQNPLRVQHSLDQYFDVSAGRLMTEQTRGNHPGVIEYHKIAGLDKSGQVGKLPMLK